MLGYVALVYLAVLSARLAFSLRSHKEVIERYGSSNAQFIGLQLSLILYVVSLIGFAIPVGALKYFAPIPRGFLFLVPGIVLGRKISSRLETAGNDVAEKTSRVVSNAFWLGVGTAIFLAGNIGLQFIMQSGNG